MTSPAPRVLCFGEALVDRLVGPEGGDHLGGAPANAACALARLGTPAAFLGRLGRDGTGAAFAALFQERGVNSAGLQWDGERPSRTVLVQRDSRGERSFGGFFGDRGAGFADQAVEREPLLAALPPLLAEACWLLVGTLSLASPASAAAQEALVAAATEAGLGLAVDVNWRPTFWGLAPEAPPPAAARAAIAALLERADLIKCAAEEAAWLFGAGADPAAISAAFPRQPALLITDGPRPVRWWAGGRGGSQGAFAVPVVDTTGAGDAFTAGLLHRLCARPLRQPGGLPPLAESVAFAAACGALTCRGAGAIDPQPTAAEVEALLRESTPQPA